MTTQRLAYSRMPRIAGNQQKLGERSDHEDLRGTVGIILPVGWKELKDEAEMKRGMLLSGSHSEVS